MVKLKICGIKRIEDINIINKYKIDYIGFVFAESPRKISFNKARELSNLLNNNIVPVGVFVNENINFIVKLYKEKIIKIAQLHGTEDENYIKNLKNKSYNETGTQIPIINAIEIKNININSLNKKLSKLNETSADYIILDSGKGSGKPFNWNLIDKNKTLKKPFFLAGGLNNKNLRLAINEFNPYAVDLSSGVETDGFKDEEKIKEIVEIVKQ
jgi:phosphoribosylanthranilate isomerase